MKQATLFGPSEPVEERRARIKRRLDALVLSEPLANPMLRVLNLGLGLQSVTLALMSARGELPMLDVAIFADTGDEKRKTYAYLEYLRPLLPFPILVERVKGSKLGEHAIKVANEPVTRTAGIPWHTANPDGMLPKQCNGEFKKQCFLPSRDYCANAPANTDFLKGLLSSSGSE